MKPCHEISKIAAAWVGVIVGAGFASGQEILQFFVSFGRIGLFGVVVATLGFMFLTMALAVIGQRLAAGSHKEVALRLMGPYLGKLFDWAITVFLFAVTVVMLAGGGSLLQQWLGVPVVWGSVLVMLLTVLVVCLNVQQVIVFIAAAIPLLVFMIVIVAGYVLATAGSASGVLETAAATQAQASSHWLLAAFLYISYNLVSGMPFLVIMGGEASSRRVALWGGLLGGLALGLLIFLSAVALYWRVDTLAGVDMPMLALAGQMSPWLFHLMSLLIFAMIANTAVGMLYAFVARIAPINTPRFRWTTAAAGVLALAGSFVGFVTLVGTVYPIYGYIGFVLIASVILAWLRWARLEAAPR